MSIHDTLGFIAHSYQVLTCLFCLLSYACHFPLDPYYFDRNVLLRNFYILLIQNKLLMTLHFEV